MRIHTIFKQIPHIILISKEGTIYLKVSCGSIRNAADIPVVSFPTCRYNVFSQFGIQNMRFIPNCRNTCYKISTLSLPFIIARCVTQHIQRGFKYHIQSQLPTTGTLAHRFRVAREITALHSISHCTLCIIHRPCHLTDKRNRHIIFYLIHTLRTPFHVLQSMNSLKIQYIRISTVQSGRLIHAMQVKEQFIFSAGFRRPIIESDHFLIIPIHKINLETLHSQFSIMATQIFHISVECIITGP